MRARVHQQHMSMLSRWCLTLFGWVARRKRGERYQSLSGERLDPIIDSAWREGWWIDGNQVGSKCSDPIETFWYASALSQHS
mmetsp:Transcript_37054/g.37374  ORF Transcript_37054/g.37374 Transcript_37054/m.37374 type:complete len:82 (+) Transcript_37054:383-628(+)